MKKLLISLNQVCKTYNMYSSTNDRLKEVFNPFNKTYHYKKNILENINLNLYEQEVVGIIGANGAGKSTLLKIISEIIPPSKGSIIINGKVSALIELGASFHPEYTGKENIYFYCTTQGLTTQEIDLIYQDICEFADIGEYIQQPVKYYSSGMFARLAFSAAIHLTPDILIVDEILSVGDVFFQQKCMIKMKELIKQGSTVLFVSHDLHAVKFFCDRAILIEDGKIKIDSYDVVSVIDTFEKGIITKDPEINIQNQKDFFEILSTEFYGQNKTKKRHFKVNEDIYIKINYRVNMDNLNYFIGFGARNHDGIYVFGVNTKLDKITLPSDKGEYSITLHFKSPALYKGIFNTWSVIYNDEGTSLLGQYLIKDAFEIFDTQETCEGIVNLNRNWSIQPDLTYDKQ